MLAELSSNTHQAYGFAYDKIVVGWGVPQNSPQPQPVQDEKPPCDTSRAAVERAAQGVISGIPGSSIGELDRQPVIKFPGNYSQTVKQLDGAGYYRGILANNALNHPGGLEFRTYGSPGFHFKVVYPQLERIRDDRLRGRVGTKPVNSPAIATDLHIDCNNPVGAGVGDMLRHGVDFIRHNIP